MGTSIPVEIEKHGATEVRVVWQDGHRSIWRNADLRWACGCASCVDEWTGERRLRRDAVAEDVQPVGVELVGNYAVHFEWSDGHGSGIYSYDYLRSICPCEACTAGRGSAS